jgi:hypothetical protein
VHVDALAHAGEPVAGGLGSHRGRAVPVVEHLDLDHGPHGDRDAGPGVRPGVLAHVGQRLLHDPVRRQPDGGRHGPVDAVEHDLDVTGQQVGQVDEPRQRGAPGRLVGAQEPEQLAHVGERLPPGGGDPGERVGGDLGVLGRGVAGAVGLHDDDREPVRDDVVHLPGDPGALVGGRQRDPLLGVAGDPVAALDDGVDVGLAGARGRAERPADHHERGHRQHVRNRVAQREVAAEPGDPVDRGHDRRTQPDDQRGQSGAPAAEPGSRVDRDRERDLGVHRDVGDHDLQCARESHRGEDQRRPLTPPPQRQRLQRDEDGAPRLRDGEVQRSRQRQADHDHRIEDASQARAEPPRPAYVVDGLHRPTVGGPGGAVVSPRDDADRPGGVSGGRLGLARFDQRVVSERWSSRGDVVTASRGPAASDRPGHRRQSGRAPGSTSVW